MRMWNVNTRIMCNRHLLGEHVEMHMFVGSLIKGISLKGYIDAGLLEVHNIKKRHKELEEEMIRRGMRHYSPLLISDNLLTESGKINRNDSTDELLRRCKDCKRRYEETKLVIME